MFFGSPEKTRKIITTRYNYSKNNNPSSSELDLLRDCMNQRYPDWGHLKREEFLIGCTNLDEFIERVILYEKTGNIPGHFSNNN